jgi:hypothetical protein
VQFNLRLPFLRALMLTGIASGAIVVEGKILIRLVHSSKIDVPKV